MVAGWELGWAQQRFYFWFLTTLAQTARGIGFPFSPKLDCLGDFSFRAVSPVVVVVDSTAAQPGTLGCRKEDELRGQKVALQFLLSFWLLKSVFMDNKSTFFSPSGDCFPMTIMGDFLAFTSQAASSLPCPAEEGVGEGLGVWRTCCSWTESQNFSHNTAALQSSEEWRQSWRDTVRGTQHRQERHKMWNTKRDH